MQRGNTLWGFLGGLLLGLLIAFGIVWYLNKTPLPFVEKVSPPGATGDIAPGSQPLPLPGKPGDKPRERTQLDFYNILPGAQPTSPSISVPEATAPAEAPAIEIKPVEVLYLQAGAFQKAGDAEKLKARLALLGVETTVQEANIADKGVLHRVRVGPFASVDEMNRVRTMLAQNGVQTTVAKQKETSAP